jgi:hypothetical protein
VEMSILWKSDEESSSEEQSSFLHLLMMSRGLLPFLEEVFEDGHLKNIYLFIN